VGWKQARSETGGLFLPPTHLVLAAGLAVALLGCAAAALVTSTTFLERSPLLLFFFPVLGAAALGRLLAGVFAALVSVAVVDWVILSPRHQLTASAEDIAALAVFLAVALLISWMVASREQDTTRAEYERARAETALGRLHQALNAGEFGSWEWDPAEGTVVWDGALERLYGLEPGAFDGRFDTYRALAHPDDRDALSAQIERARSAGEPFSVQHRVIRPNGDVVYVQGWGATRQDAEGNVVAMFGIVHDVTAQIEQREHLRSLHDQAVRVARVNERLRSFAAALASAVEPIDVAKAVVATGREVIGADTGLLYELNESELQLSAAEGYLPGQLDAWVSMALEANAPIPDAIRSGTSVVLEDRVAINDAYPYMAAAEVRDAAIIALPLVWNDEPIAGLFFAFHEAHPFDDEQRALVTAVANLASQALARARLFTAVQLERERIGHLSAVADAGLSSLVEKELFAELLPRARRAVWADTIRILLHRGDGRFVATAGDGSLPPGWIGQTWEQGRGFVGRVVAARQIIVQPDATQEAFARPDAYVGLQTVVGVPVISNDAVLGMLEFGWTEPLDVREDQLELMALVAARVGSAVERSNLYRDRDALAHALGRSMAPPAMPQIPGVELSGLYRPGRDGDEVGGDLYAVFRTADDRWMAVVADVCGRGPNAAAVMGRVRHMFRALALKADGPADALQQLNALLLAEDESAPFVTACALQIDVSGGSTLATIASAGHPQPFLVRADRTVSEVPTTGMLLGVEPNIPVDDVTLELADRDTLVVFTDGLFERPHGDDLLLSGVVREVMRSTCGLSAGEVVDVLDTRLIRPAEPLHDDVAILVASISGE
jgi:PAS domain S-box-containing protein